LSAFQQYASIGVLAEEQLRGCRFNIIDVKLHSDRVHRGAAQLMPATRKVMYSTQLTAKPRLVEPVFKVEIQTDEQVMGSIYNVINKRKGTVINTERRE